MVYKVLRELYHRAFWGSRQYQLRRLLRDCESVLDLGCGDNSPLQLLARIPNSVGVDIFPAALSESRRKGVHDHYVQGDLRQLPFRDQCVDCVLLSHVVEHLTKVEACELLQRIECLAKKRMVLFLPNGFVWQDAYDGNPWQIHMSEWSVTDFKTLGYKVRGLSGLRQLKGYMSRVRYRPQCIWKAMSHLTEVVVYFLPQFSFELLCVKDAEKDKAT